MQNELTIYFLTKHIQIKENANYYKSKTYDL